MSKFLNALPSISLILVLIYAYYVYVVELCILIIKPLVKQILYLIFFHIIFISFMGMGFVTAFHKKWTVPERYWFDEEFYEKILLTDSEEKIYNLVLKFCKQRRLRVFTRTAEGNFRICEICELLKPDRTHHCSKCGTCVLKMDHHCPWLNNCIGFTNHKYFMVTVLYGGVYCIYYFGTTLEYVFLILRYYLSQGNWRTINILITCALSLIIGGAVVTLLVYHLTSIFKNETTFESMHSPTFATLQRTTFSKGRRDNFIEVCGANPILWCLPINKMNGDGTYFEIHTSYTSIESG